MALHFTPSEFADIPDLAVTTPAQFTLVAWINPDIVSAGNRVWISTGAVGSEWQNIFRQEAADLFCYQRKVGGGFDVISETGSPLVAGTWHRVAATRDGSGDMRFVLQPLQPLQSTPGYHVWRLGRGRDHLKRRQYGRPLQRPAYFHRPRHRTPDEPVVVVFGQGGRHRRLWI